MTSSEQLHGQNTEKISLQYSFLLPGVFHEWKAVECEAGEREVLISARDLFFFFLIEKLHLESPWLCLLQRLLIVTIYSGHGKVLTHSPFGDPSTLNSCVSFFCPQWDSPQPKPMWSMLSRWPLQCKYYGLFSNLLFVGCWKELAADAEVATLVFDFVSTNL